MTDSLPREYILRGTDDEISEMVRRATARLRVESRDNPDSSAWCDAWLWYEQVHGEMLLRIYGGL